MSPRHRAGTSPALTRLDFPLPLGPITAKNRASRWLFIHAVDKFLD